MECQKKILKIYPNKTATLHQLTFINHHLLADINFNGHCLINNSIPIPKINKSIYFLHTKSMVKKFKRRFDIK